MAPMSDPWGYHTAHELVVKGNLEELIRRLKPGMKVPARIVECLGHGTYVLRVWGFNMISESHHPFNRFEEVELEVQATQPKLIFNLKPLSDQPGGALYA